MSRLIFESAYTRHARRERERKGGFVAELWDRG